MGYIKWYLNENKKNPKGVYAGVLGFIDFLKWLYKHKYWIIAFFIVYIVMFYNLNNLFAGSDLSYGPECIAYIIVVGLFSFFPLSVYYLLRISLIDSYLKYRKSKNKS